MGTSLVTGGYCNSKPCRPGTARGDDADVTPVTASVTDNIVMNEKKPPFDNVKVRLAVSYAIDRRGLIKGVHQDGAVPAVAMMPRPYGVWGVLDRDLATLQLRTHAERVAGQVAGPSRGASLDYSRTRGARGGSGPVVGGGGALQLRHPLA
jgi:hypothetical protein